VHRAQGQAGQVGVPLSSRSRLARALPRERSKEAHGAPYCPSFCWRERLTCQSDEQVNARRCQKVTMPRKVPAPEAHVTCNWDQENGVRALMNLPARHVVGLQVRTPRRKFGAIIPLHACPIRVLTRTDPNKKSRSAAQNRWSRGLDLNQRPLGYEPAQEDIFTYRLVPESCPEQDFLMVVRTR